ncbi:hypothetical protein E4U21_005456 [Claviceps maximensis]|nr:hypothetical protein E4U21_005456 [Claviceps maximensis]
MGSTKAHAGEAGEAVARPDSPIPIDWDSQSHFYAGYMVPVQYRSVPAEVQSSSLFPVLSLATVTAMRPTLGRANNQQPSKPSIRSSLGHG